MQCFIFYSVTVLSFKCDFPVALCMFRERERERVRVCVHMCVCVCVCTCARVFAEEQMTM